MINNFGSDGGEDNEDLLKLSLSTGPKSPSAAPTPPLSLFGLPTPQPPSLPLMLAVPELPPQTSLFQQFLPIIPQAPSPLSSYLNHQSHNPTGLKPNNDEVAQEIVSHSRPSRSRRNRFQTPRQGKNDTIPPPFPWATNQRATVHNLDYLLSHNLTTISGEVQCKKCEKVYKIEYDLEEKFRNIASFISENRFAMHDRAPPEWMNPKLPSCESCGSCMKPLILKKRSINWLFLLLGEMLGCCKLADLKYFCKHTKNHRTAAKDRVLYLTYLGLCRQLDPKGPFDI